MEELIPTPEAATESPQPPREVVSGSADQVIAAAIRQILNQAIAFHQAGRFGQAAQLYGEILKLDPRHADSLHLLGMVASQAHRPDLAIDLIQKAIALNGRVAAYHSNLGSILQALGRLDEAEALYTQALALDPRMAEIHLNFGLLLQTQGKLSQAVEEYEAAVALNPALAEAHSNLGNGLQAQGHLDSAILHYEEALRLKPAFVEAWYNLGNAHLAQEKLDEAAASYERALALNPLLAEAHCNLGNVLKGQQKPDEAIAHYQRALALKPGYGEAHYNLANALSGQEKMREAVAEYELALHFDPLCAKAHNNLGNVFRSLEEPEKAVAHYKQVPDGDPEFTDAYNNLGLALLSLGRHEEAIQSIARTLALKPHVAEAYCNMGAVLHALNRVPEACAAYQKALELKPDLPKARINLGMIQLLSGDFANGWKNYELRWDDAPLHRREFTQPQWQGEPLDGRRILLHAEQGLGDTLQFLRYVPMVQAAGGVVILEVQDRLRTLAAELPGVAQVVSTGAPLPEFDCHCPLLSLPAAFGTTLESVPASIPYLKVPQAAIAKAADFPWPEDGLRIGILWAGNPVFPNDRCRFRSAPIEVFRPLLELEGAHLFSLQVGEHAGELFEFPEFARRVVDLSPLVADMSDTAAQIARLDLVVMVDTSVSHLAGALGVPVWVLTPFTPDWRWLQKREDTPWYPSMRLFRQPHPGDWASVVEAMMADLKKLCSVKDQTSSLRLSSRAFSAAISLLPDPEAPATPAAVAVYSPLLSRTLPE
jgi:tetratricopeptide (TPR) repeat protein